MTQDFTYETLDDLGAQTAAAALAGWLLRPELPEAEWIDLLVGILTSAALQAESWGRAYGSVAQPVDGGPILPTDDIPRRPAPRTFEQRSTTAPKPGPVIDVAQREAELRERLTKAVKTLASQDDASARLERLAVDEPVAAAQRGFQDGIRLADSGVTGYRRGINPDCCELCFWLWKEGYVYEIDQPMHRHTGCRCVPVPTTDRLGRHPLSGEDQQLLDDLYDRYVT